MSEITSTGSARNFVQELDMSNYLVETELFPRDILEAYSAWNLEKEITSEQQQHFSALLGGG